MFEDISKPLKGKGKEKDVGKRRAYVRVVTSLGGASLNLELYCEKVRLDFFFSIWTEVLNVRF
jgi:peptidyl-prolyl cis-trans isomerase-like 2